VCRIRKLKKAAKVRRFCRAIERERERERERPNEELRISPDITLHQRFILIKLGKMGRAEYVGNRGRRQMHTKL
jgi:hypothetical protein